jgi:hypothetical protein
MTKLEVFSQAIKKKTYSFSVYGLAQIPKVVS